MPLLEQLIVFLKSFKIVTDLLQSATISTYLLFITLCIQYLKENCTLNNSGLPPMEIMKILVKKKFDDKIKLTADHFAAQIFVPFSRSLRNCENVMKENAICIVKDDGNGDNGDGIH